MLGKVVKRSTLLIAFLCIVYLMALVCLNVVIARSYKYGAIVDMRSGQEYKMTDADTKKFIDILCPIIGMPQIHSNKDAPIIIFKLEKMDIGILPDSQMVCINGFYFRVSNIRLENISDIIVSQYIDP